MKKVIITDSVDKKCTVVLEDAGIEVSYKPGMQKEEIGKVIGDYNGLIVRSDTKVTSDLIGKMDKMEVIGRAGTGVDNIDVEAATRKGIIVMNTPCGNTISAAEHTISLMMSMCRNIPQASHSLYEGKWNRKSFKGTELQGKTLGIIGLGKIGREVGLRAKSFGMEVIGYDPLLSFEAASKIGLRQVDLDLLFKTSDIITVHVPLTDETKYIISEGTLSKCKNGVKIINCARGGIVSEKAVLNALDSGKVSAAAFDVYETEPPDFSNPLFKHPKVVCTPHLGASTEEAQEKVAVQIAKQIAGLFNDKTVAGAVNASAVEDYGKKELAPFVRLAECLGILHAQLTRGKMKEININFNGEYLHPFSQLLSTAVLKGFLSRMMTVPVNLISAPLLAKEMGIVVNEIKSGAGANYSSLITVEFSTEKEKRSFAGTVFGNNEIRIVYVDQFHLELKPEGTMLFYTNIDKPGMLAAVGKVLAEAEINIAGLSLGRIEIGKEALTVINVDNEISGEVASKLASIDGVKELSVVKI